MMKSKILLPLVLLTFMSLASFGQAQFAVGIKAGANFSKIDPQAGAANTDNVTGFNAGAFALVKVLMIGVQPELQFSKQGSTFKVNTDSYEANFDYINVPIILKFYLPLGLNLQAGPQFGFLSIADLKNTAQSTNSGQDVKALFSDKNDVAVALGAGWDLPLGLTIDFRYNLGLNEMKFTPPSTSSNPNPGSVSFKNKVIQLSVGYKLIKLGGK
jgi:hypothetical protein